MKIILKKVNELSNSESAQLEALIYRYYNSASDKFIADRLKKDLDYDIVMLKEGDIIQGVNFYHLTKYRVSNWGRTYHILHFGQAMKRSGYRGNIIWRLGRWYSRKKISRLYLLENVTGIASFISPKAFEHFTRLFPRYHYKLNTENDASVHEFMVDYFNKARGISYFFNNGFCFDSSDLEKEEITKDWNKIYRAKNDFFNQLFIDAGIIKMEDNRIYKMPRHITVCGIHRPIPFNKKLNLPQTSILKNAELIF